MGLKIMSLRANLLFVLFGLSLFIFAQTKNGDKKLLQGKWVFEEAYTEHVNLNRTLYLDLYNSYVEIYPEIEISQDKIILLDNEYGKLHKVNYEVSGNYLGFDFSLGKAFIAEWTIFEDKLYMEQSVIYPEGGSKEITVLLTYKRK